MALLSFPKIRDGVTVEIQVFQKSPAGRLVRTVDDAWAFAPSPLPPSLNWSPELVDVLSAADRALGELAGVGRTLPNSYLFIRPFVRREAVLSSRIEGTQASISDLYAYEAAPLALSASRPDVLEVYHYVQALEYGLERLQSLPLGLRLIRELHALLMEGVRGERQTLGVFRTRQNWIGAPGCSLSEASYVPPPVGEMRKALDALERFVHAETQLPPLVCLGLIHYQFEAIHPFLDGNGRIGRLLVSLLCCAWDLLPRPLLYLSAFFHAHRTLYYDSLLAVSRDGAWESWLVFFLNGVRTQSLDAVARIQRIQDLHESYRERFQSSRAAARFLQLVDLLFAQPVLTVRQVADALDVTFPTAQQYARRLQDWGLLREITGGARNRVYRADQVIEAIEAPL
jgi:Fic family protein